MKFSMLYLLLGLGRAFGLLSCLSVAIFLGRTLLKRGSKSLKSGMPQKKESFAGQSISTVTPGNLKTSTVIRILILLITILPAVGYAIGVHQQNKRDIQLAADRYSKYDLEHSAWIEKNKQWARDYETWKSKHPLQENVNVRRSISTSPSTRAATYTASAESIAFRR